MVEGLLYDFGQMTLPFDNVDKEDLKKPKKLDVKSLKRFMFFMGPLSSCFDLIVFAYMWFVLGIRTAVAFQTIWFTYSIISNLLGLFIIRTSKTPIKDSNASKPVYFSSFIIIIVAILLPYTVLGKAINLVPIRLNVIIILFAISILYCIVATSAKKYYIKKHGEWI